MYQSDWQILGVQQTAGQDEIKAAYRELVKKYHPDRNAGNEKEAAANFMKVQAAYERLINDGDNFSKGGQVTGSNDFEEWLKKYRAMTANERAEQVKEMKDEIDSKFGGSPVKWLLHKIMNSK